MQLVIDANIAFSLLKKDSFSRKLMREHKLELYSHPFILDELRKHASELCAKVGVSDDKFDRLLLILSKLIIVDKPSQQIHNRALSLISDKDDAPYIASAIKIGCAIWSNDPHLKEQLVVKVYTTKELAAVLQS